MSKETIMYCKATPIALYATDVDVPNSILVGKPISAIHRFQNYHNHYTMWTRRDDLEWVLKIKDEVREFIEESGGVQIVIDEFGSYEYPQIYNNKGKTEVVIAWIQGLPLAMPGEHNKSIIEKMKKYGYNKDNPIEVYYEVFSVFIADTVFEATNRDYSYDWSKFTKDNPYA